MPFIEEYIASHREPKSTWKPLEIEYELRPLGVKHQVIHHKAGCTFIGTMENCRAYIQQQRSKQAVRKAELEFRRGANPAFTR
jgi:hypothetical protein